MSTNNAVVDNVVQCQRLHGDIACTCQDAIPEECTQAVIRIPQQIFEPVKHQARHIFLRDTIVLTPDSSTVSRGHFANLADLLSLSPGSSALRAAVDAVALTSLATRFGMSDVRAIAMAQYASSIRHMKAEMIASTYNAESLIASISVLSLYEILNADVTDNLNCVKHLRGILAILHTQIDLRYQRASEVQLLLLSTEEQREVADGLRDTATCSTDRSADANESTPQLLRSPQPVTLQFSELCSILPKVTGLFTKAAAELSPQSIRFENQLKPLRKEAFALRSQMLAWSTTQAARFRSVTIRRFTQPYNLSFPDCRQLTCPVLRADCYPDYLVAYVWTTYWNVQLNLANLICRLNSALSESISESTSKREAEKFRQEVETYIDDISASIPFMLAGDSIRYCEPTGTSWHLHKPPMLLGGLSMQWVLFNVATLGSAPAASKRHARDILSWFGDVLGIGQSKVLAQMYENPGITAKGDALRWSGFLL